MALAYFSAAAEEFWSEPWGHKAAIRRLLYTPPALRLLGHMLLAVAVKRWMALIYCC